MRQIQLYCDFLTTLLTTLHFTPALIVLLQTVTYANVLPNVSNVYLRDINSPSEVSMSAGNVNLPLAMFSNSRKMLSPSNGYFPVVKL